MSKNKLININDYTLINEDKTNIYFFPQFSLFQEKVQSTNKNLYVLFELKKEKEQDLYSTHISMVNSDSENLYSSYLIYFVEIDQNKYAIINSKNNIETKKNKYKEIIDFNKLDYETFINLIRNNKKLSKMLPELTNELKKSLKNLKSKKATVGSSQQSEIFNYYQNVSGYLINELESFLTIEEEKDISTSILKNVKNNYPVVLYNQSHLNLAYLGLYAFIINKVKSSFVKPDSVLEKKYLKIELPEFAINKEEFEKILPSILNTKEKKSTNELTDCITSIIDYSSNKVVTKKLKVLMASSKYLDGTSKSKYITEDNLKDLILSSFINLWYYPLPQGQVLIYNFDNDNIEFICISSLDILYELFVSYKKNTNNKETKEYIHLLKSLGNLITDNVQKKTQSFIRIYLLTLIVTNLYNYRCINKDALLFDKGDYILNLTFDKGKYNITVVNAKTSQKVGRLIKVKEQTQENISSSLKNSEREFTKVVNKIIYNNLESALLELSFIFNVTDVSHKGITITIQRPQKEDIFECKLTAEQLLVILSSIKPSKTEKLVKLENKEEKEIKKIPRVISEKDEAYIVRKCHTIVDIMKKQNLDNDKYRKIVKLYKELNKSKDKRRNEILLELKELI